MPRHPVSHRVGRRFRTAVPAIVLLTGLSSLTSRPSLAQTVPVLTTPKESPRAAVSQVVGLTTIGLTYDRPAVKGRQIWGGLVPYDSVWRAGANENTVFSFSSPVTVGGSKLPAGRYGFHLIPTATQWTLIFSHEAGAWGSFSYRQSEDALRFTATPRPADLLERLQYTLDEPTDSSVNVTLRWEKMAVSFPVTVATNDVVIDSIQQQLRGLPRFWPQVWAESARWALVHNSHLDLGAAWADTAAQIQPNFPNLRLKATYADRSGDKAGAEQLRQRALAVATEVDVNALGYQLMGQGKMDEALVLFHKNIKDHPDSWNAFDSLGEALAKKGDKKLAVANYTKALNMTTDPQQKQRINGILAGLRTGN